MTVQTQQAVILAAGNGDRFGNGSHASKLVASIGGVPLIAHTLRAACSAGLTMAHVVVGYDARRVADAARAWRPDALGLHFHHNRRWNEENGVSLLTAEPCCRSTRFALLMGDHIFEPRVLRRLLTVECETDEMLLAVDRTALGRDAEEATRVRLEDGRVSAIAKRLEPFDAIDTGLFVCSPALFAAARQSCAADDTTLSGGVRRLARLGLVRAVDIDGARWCDVDTRDDLATAESIVASRDDP